MNSIIGVESWNAVCSADRGVGGARPARDEADARPAAQLALRIGHERRAALLPAGDEADAIGVLVKAIEHGQEALAGHAEHGVDALGHQGLHQGVAGDSLRHGRPRSNTRGDYRQPGTRLFSRATRTLAPQEL